ncbi:MAG: site-2 protease family protein [Planctomycetota bacterium]
MLLQEPGHSPYDLRFELLGFPVRVAWSFWLAALLIGWQIVLGVEGILGDDGLPMPALFAIWSGCVFLSILIHELGHALAFRQFGVQSSVVLYYLGGLAIPTSSYSPDRGFGNLSPKQDMWVSFAGPLAQLLSAAVVGLIVVLLGYELTVLRMMGAPFDMIPGAEGGERLDVVSPGLFALVTFYIFPSVLWAILNLIPVWPLDGGHIVRSAILSRGGNVVQALWVSVIAAALVCVYGFSVGDRFLGVMFLVLGVSSFQAIQQLSGPRFG